MEKNNLYHIQDADRPMWVVAPNWTEALKRWTNRMALENDQKPEEVETCRGIQLVCEADDLIC